MDQDTGAGSSVEDESPRSVEEEELLPGAFSDNVDAKSRSGPQGLSGMVRC